MRRLLLQMVHEFQNICSGIWQSIDEQNRNALPNPVCVWFDIGIHLHRKKYNLIHIFLKSSGLKNSGNKKNQFHEKFSLSFEYFFPQKLI